MIKHLLKRIIAALPLRDVIVFESAPDCSDNTKAVFDEMIRRGMNNRYKMVWLVSKKSDTFPQYPNVSYYAGGFGLTSFKWHYYRFFAKVFICCNHVFPTSFRVGQYSFYLTHGTTLKSVRNYYFIEPKIDYMLVDGEGTRETMAYELSYDLQKTVALGFPRNDILTQPPRDVHALFPGHEHEKIAVWYPTFRQHKNGRTATAKPLPFLHDEQQAEQLNELAKRAGVLLVLKPHFAQDISKIKARNFSHIVFINDDFFAEHNISSYEFIAACDAMITDYSSVYYDFLLCDKPIGLVWEDYEEYKDTVDFAVDMDYHMKAGNKIYTLPDFDCFLQDLAAGNDTLHEARAEISAWANYSRDGKSAQRVVDFIVEKAGM